GKRRQCPGISHGNRGYGQGVGTRINRGHCARYRIHDVNPVEARIEEHEVGAYSDGNAADDGVERRIDGDHKAASLVEHIYALTVGPRHHPGGGNPAESRQWRIRSHALIDGVDDTHRTTLVRHVNLLLIWSFSQGDGRASHRDVVG